MYASLRVGTLLWGGESVGLLASFVLMLLLGGA